VFGTRGSEVQIPLPDQSHTIKTKCEKKLVDSVFSVMMVIDFFLVLFLYPEPSNIFLEQMQHKCGIG
jgi:hypothetical protein